MDPDEILDEQRELAKQLEDVLVQDAASLTAEALGEKVQILDEWIMQGGMLPAEWANKANGGLLRRADLALEVYEQMLKATESFEGKLGMYMTYLLGAILKKTYVDLEQSETELIEQFKLVFSADHKVWKYLRITGQDPVG